MSLDRLIEGIAACKNPTVVGLDPALGSIPPAFFEDVQADFSDPLEGAAAAVTRFNCKLIDALCDIVPAVKPQAAYYEVLGYHGMKALYDTVVYAGKKGMYVILDGKRGDIGPTMEAYGQAYLGITEINGRAVEAFPADAMTVNGYLGADCVEPLLTLCHTRDKGIFVLVKTSNPSSGELQDQMVGGETVYSLMGGLCRKWGGKVLGQYGYSGVGAVVGATYPRQLAELRAALPDVFFLVPGYGAQGGGAADVAGAFDSRGLGAVVNASRSILCAWKRSGERPEDFAAAARREAIRMRDDITAAIPPICLS